VEKERGATNVLDIEDIERWNKLLKRRNGEKPKSLTALAAHCHSSKNILL
jgi:hypothetical protein